MMNCFQVCFQFQLAPLFIGATEIAVDEYETSEEECNKPHGRGLHSFPFQLNLSTSFHHITQLNS
jgi:hypothetical protein